MIKVLHVLSDSNVGGAGRLLVNYLRNFDRKRFDVKVVLPKDSALKPFIEAEGYEVIEILHGRDRSMDFAAAREISDVIRRWKPDIVHTHSAFSGKLAAFLCRTPARFYTRHSAFPQPKHLTTFPGKQLNGLVNNLLATDIVAVAQAAADNLTETGVDPRKITVIINGSEEARRTSPEEQRALREQLKIPEGAFPEGPFICGISARLEPYKGHSYLLESIKLVREEVPSLVCLIIGDGSCAEGLRQSVKELGIEENVRFTGFVPDVAPYYNLMQLNLNCSWGTETSCLALSEGMSLSIPAIATTYGGNPYMITEGVNGFLVPEKDSRAMADAMLRIIRDDALRAQLAAGARVMYEKKFTASAMTRQLEKLYEEAAKRKNK